MTIKIDISKPQLNVLLSQIEALFVSEPFYATRIIPRGPDLAKAALAVAPNSSSYDISMIAPAYLQLVAAWEKKGTVPATVNDPEWQRRWGRKHA